MIWIIKVPKEYVTQKDIKQIVVMTEDEMDKMYARQIIDNTFDPIEITLDVTLSALDFNHEVVRRAFSNSCNLIMLQKHGVRMYRAKEARRVGTDYTGLGVGVIVLNNEGQIVLTLRGGMANNRRGMWELPGGTVEFGDNLEKTVVKEIKEETNLVVLPKGCISITQDYVENQHWISFGFVANVVSGELENNEPYKFDEVKFFDIDKLPENTAKLTLKVIKDYQKNKDQFIDVSRVEQ